MKPQHERDRLGKHRRTGRLTVPGEGDVADFALSLGRIACQPVTIDQRVEKAAQLGFEYGQIDIRRLAAHQIRNLAVSTMPVAGIVRIQIDPDRHPAGPSRQYRIDVGQAGQVAVVIVDGQAHGI